MKLKPTPYYFAKAWTKRAIKAVKVFNVRIIEEGTRDFTCRNGVVKQVQQLQFELDTPLYGVLKGTVYDDWLHLRIDNLALFKLHYPQYFTQNGVQGAIGDWSGKWNLHCFERDYDVDSLIAELNFRMALINVAQPLFPANGVDGFKCGDHVTWHDPDNGECTESGVIRSITPRGDHVSICFTNGWMGEVFTSELLHCATA